MDRLATVGGKESHRASISAGYAVKSTTLIVSTLSQSSGLREDSSGANGELIAERQALFHSRRPWLFASIPTP